MPFEIAPNYKPHTAQQRMHRSGARFLSVAAGVRGGKTKGAAAEFGYRIARDFVAGKGNRVSGTGRKRRPRLHYWVVTPTASLLREPTRYLFEVFPQGLIERFYDADNALWLQGDILVEFKSADNPLHLVASGLHGLWIDEAARVKAEAWRGQLRQRLSDHSGWALFSTTPLGRNWLYDEIISKSGADPDFENVSWTTADNPIIPRTEIESAKRQLPRRYFEREYLASFDSFLGNVFDEWDESIHVINREQFLAEYGIGTGRRFSSVFRRVVAGVDWGWNSPGSIVVLGDLGNQYVVIDESYAPNRLLHDPRLPSGDTWTGEARRLKDLYGITQFYADPARPDAIFDFQRIGLPVLGADNDVLFGVRKLSEGLHVGDGRPKLRILDNCRNLIRELRAYQWSPNKGKDTFTEYPAPNQSDHAIDALRYAFVEADRYATNDIQTYSARRFGSAARPIG